MAAAARAGARGAGPGGAPDGVPARASRRPGPGDRSCCRVRRATADAESATRLADLFDTLYVHLVEHLDAEEERLLPLAARCMTQAEWDEMGEVARREAPRKEGLLAMGMFQHEGDPEVFALMLADAPRPCAGCSRA